MTDLSGGVWAPDRSFVQRCCRDRPLSESVRAGSGRCATLLHRATRVKWRRRTPTNRGNLRLELRRRPVGAAALGASHGSWVSVRQPNPTHGPVAVLPAHESRGAPNTRTGVDRLHAIAVSRPAEAQPSAGRTGWPVPGCQSALSWGVVLTAPGAGRVA